MKSLNWEEMLFQMITQKRSCASEDFCGFVKQQTRQSSITVLQPPSPCRCSQIESMKLFTNVLKAEHLKPGEIVTVSRLLGEISITDLTPLSVFSPNCCIATGPTEDFSML